MRDRICENVMWNRDTDVKGGTQMSLLVSRQRKESAVR